MSDDDELLKVAKEVVERWDEWGKWLDTAKITLAGYAPIAEAMERLRTASETAIT